MLDGGIMGETAGNVAMTTGVVGGVEEVFLLNKTKENC